jgi:hypothetical protein
MCTSTPKAPQPTAVKDPRILLSRKAFDELGMYIPGGSRRTGNGGGNGGNQSPANSMFDPLAIPKLNSGLQTPG